MTISEYLKTTESKINNLQYQLELEVELKKAKEVVKNLEKMLNIWEGI